MRNPLITVPKLSADRYSSAWDQSSAKVYLFLEGIKVRRQTEHHQQWKNFRTTLVPVESSNEEERGFSYIDFLVFSEFCNIDNLTTRFDFPAVGVTWAVSFPWVGTPAIANLNTSNYSPLITADEHSRLLYTGEPLYMGFRAPSSFFTGWLVCLSGRARNVILITVLVLMRIDILMIF